MITLIEVGGAGFGLDDIAAALPPAHEDLIGLVSLSKPYGAMHA